MSTQTQIPTLELTNTIRTVLTKATQTNGVPSEVKDKCLRILDADSLNKENVSSSARENGSSNSETTQRSSQETTTVVPTSLIKEVYKSLKEQGQKLRLHEIVEGTQLVLQSPIPPPRNSELAARIEQLKIEEENREYRRMTRHIDPVGRTKSYTFQDDVKSMNRQLAGVLNFLVTVVAGFAFGYKAIEYSFGANMALQMMVGLFTGTIIFFVDLYFMVKYSPDV